MTEEKKGYVTEVEVSTGVIYRSNVNYVTDVEVGQARLEFAETMGDLDYYQLDTDRGSPVLINPAHVVAIALVPHVG